MTPLIRRHLLILLLLSGLVFVFQTRSVGFESNTYGWVTSHTLAQIIHATPENNFLGYTLPLMTDDGGYNRHYFDRYPFFFSAIMNRLIFGFSHDLASQIDVGRTLMNVIFCAMMFVSYFLLNSLFGRPHYSLIATIFTLSSTSLLYHKEMIHFDQPALLGMLLLLWAIARFELHNDRRWVYWAAPFAVLSGRGYASFFVLGVWAAVRLYRFRRYHREPAVWLTVASVALSGLFLFNNIWQESKIRNVSLAETSIVVSARSRLGVDAMAAGEEHSARLSKATVLQIERTFLNAVPGVFGEPRKVMRGLSKSFKSPLSAIAVVALLIGILYFVPRKLKRGWQMTDVSVRWTGAVLFFSGLIWCIFMRKLTVPHQYTQMYLIPGSLFLAMLYLVSNNAKWESKPRSQILLAAICVLFVGGLMRMRYLHDKEASRFNQYTYDIENTLKVLPEKDAKIYFVGGHREIVKGAPYAMGFYYARHWIAPEAFAEYVVTTDPAAKATSLTPQNEYIFILKKN